MENIVSVNIERVTIDEVMYYQCSIEHVDNTGTSNNTSVNFSDVYDAFDYLGSLRKND
jgi:hypothetical protein